MNNKLNRFAGTENPRYLRIIAAVLARPLPRQGVDAVAGAANGPDAISQIRDLFLDGLGMEHLYCERINFIDRDGKPCRPGVYSLSERGRKMIYEWLTRRNKSGGDHA
jgi:hypothetical protein